MLLNVISHCQKDDISPSVSLSTRVEAVCRLEPVCWKCVARDSVWITYWLLKGCCLLSRCENTTWRSLWQQGDDYPRVIFSWFYKLTKQVCKYWRAGGGRGERAALGRPLTFCCDGAQRRLGTHCSAGPSQRKNTLRQTSPEPLFISPKIILHE